MTIAGSHAVTADRNVAGLEEKRVKLHRAIRVRGGRWPEGTIRSATITREGGAWFLSVQFDGPPPKKVEGTSPPAPADKPVLSRGDYDDRFFRTLKEQLPWVRSFHSREELQDALRAFRIWYTANWLIQRDGHRTPDQVGTDQHDEAHDWQRPAREQPDSHYAVSNIRQALHWTYWTHWTL